MLVYRVFPYLPTAAHGEPGHPLYEHQPQRGGRIDHPDYYVWYVATQAAAAVGESFGNLGCWGDTMFPFPAIPGARRALGVYRLPDELRLLDLDDAAALAERALRPTQIVTATSPSHKHGGVESGTNAIRMTPTNTGGRR